MVRRGRSYRSRSRRSIDLLDPVALHGLQHIGELVRWADVELGRHQAGGAIWISMRALTLRAIWPRNTRMRWIITAVIVMLAIVILFGVPFCRPPVFAPW